MAEDITEMHPEFEGISDMEDQFERIFSKWPKSIGRDKSKEERKAKNYVSSTLAYDEIQFRPFMKLLRQLKDHGAMQNSGGKFVDVGAGIGRAVFAAALAHDWDCCVGIEVLQGLHAVSTEALSVWVEAVATEPPETRVRKEQRRRALAGVSACPELPESKQHMEIEFILGSAIVLPWDDADLVFINSICFDEDLMRQLASQAFKLKDTAIVVTMTRVLPCDRFEVIDEMKIQQDWGHATVYVHACVNQDESEDNDASLDPRS